MRKKFCHDTTNGSALKKKLKFLLQYTETRNDRDYMKKFLLIVCFCIASFAPLIALDIYESRNIVAGIKKVREPVIVGTYLVFTQEETLRHAGIAFEFEDYKTVHRFERIPLTQQGEGGGILFYILKLPEGMRHINYRLELDGLWTDDPQNPQSFYDYTLGLSVSSVAIPYSQTQKTTVLQNGAVQFYYHGAAGQSVRLAGSFNNWDPFMYEMQELMPGEYFLNLALPHGKWLYAFFIGTEQTHDSTNHDVVFSSDGKKASVIAVP